VAWRPLATATEASAPAQQPDEWSVVLEPSTACRGSRHSNIKELNKKSSVGLLKTSIDFKGENHEI
jgi:hypothetical protein